MAVKVRRFFSGRVPTHPSANDVVLWLLFEVADTPVVPLLVAHSDAAVEGPTLELLRHVMVGQRHARQNIVDFEGDCAAGDAEVGKEPSTPDIAEWRQ